MNYLSELKKHLLTPDIIQGKGREFSSVGDYTFKPTGTVTDFGIWRTTAHSSSFGFYGKNVLAIDIEYIEVAYKPFPAKVALVDWNEKVIFQKFVRYPPNLVVTNWRSFLYLKDDLHSAPSYVEIQNLLLEHIGRETILIGHAMDNDLNALQIRHSLLIDTRFTFRDMNTYEGKGLKYLAQAELGEHIQPNSQPHDPSKDAEICIKLMKKKVSSSFGGQSGIAQPERPSENQTSWYTAEYTPPTATTTNRNQPEQRGFAEEDDGFGWAAAAVVGIGALALGAIALFAPRGRNDRR